MSSTPMQIDSPMGNGIAARTNGVQSQATAILADMIPIFRPTKVRFSLMYANQAHKV